MQKILCVNVSTKIAVASLVSCEGQTISIIEQHSAELGKLFNADHSSINMPASSEESISPENIEDNTELLELAAFRELINRFSDTWTSCLLIISGTDYISLDLKLPFNNPKEISKIIDLEVQDQVPFDIQEFLIDNSIVERSAENGMHDIHVGLLPRNYLQKVMRICRACEFDPVVITSPASALAALIYILPNFFDEHCGLLYLADDACYSCIVFGGKVRSDRVFLNNWLAASANQELYQDLLREFKIYLATLESRYGSNVQKIYVLQSHLPSSLLQSALGREIVLLDTSDIIHGSQDASTVLTCTASIFVRDQLPVKPLSNFRTQEFAFKPQLKNLFSGLKALTVYLLLSFSLIIATIAAALIIDYYQANRVQNAIAEQIASIAPELDRDTQNTVSALNDVTTGLESELTSLGSPSRYTALDVLSQITKDLKKITNIDITQFKITGNRVTLIGNAESYAQSDELRAIFRRRKDMFCDVTRDSSAGVGAGATRTFQYTLELCN